MDESTIAEHANDNIDFWSLVIIAIFLRALNVKRAPPSAHIVDFYQGPRVDQRCIILHRYLLDFLESIFAKLS